MKYATVILVLNLELTADYDIKVRMQPHTWAGLIQYGKLQLHNLPRVYPKQNKAKQCKTKQYFDTSGLFRLICGSLTQVLSFK